MPSHRTPAAATVPTAQPPTRPPACLQVRGERYAPRDTATAIEPGRMREANMRLVEEFGSQVRGRDAPVPAGS